MMTRIQRPLALPAGVAEAATLTAHIDGILAEGFARLRPEQRDQLADVAAAFAGSPLSTSLHQAIERLAAGDLLAQYLSVVAAARAALEGARFDALFAEAVDALGYTAAPSGAVTAGPARAASVTARVDSVRQWLVELGLSGLAQLDLSTIVPVVATLEGLQGEPGCERFAALLTGFAFELLDHAPTHQLEDPPLRRWADMWTRALLASLSPPDAVAGRPVSGTLTVLGADIRHFDQLISMVVHAALDEGDGGPLRLVRTTLSSWKVDAVAGAEIWNLVSPLAPELVGALAKPQLVTVSGATLLDTGDLLADGAFKAGKPAKAGGAGDPFALDLTGAMVHRPAPRDRHPLQLGLPVVGTPEGLAVALSRLSPHSDYDADEVASSTDMVGLLRFDDDWSLQPLAGRKGKTIYGPAEGIAAAAKVKKSALGILRERAGKLLRK